MVEWTDIDFDHRVIRLDAGKVKIKRGRVIDLDVSPSLLDMLERLPRRGPYVFGDDRPVPDLRY